MSAVTHVSLSLSWKHPATRKKYTLAISNNSYGILVDKKFFSFKNQMQPVFRSPDCNILKTETAGDIQFGAPAEIIKVLMGQQTGVPQTLVLAADFVKNGILLNELEFVLYHNVFFQGRRLRIIGTKQQIAAAQAVMQESFFGPRKEDLARLGSLEAAGYYEKELTHFRSGLAFVLKKINPNRDPSQGLPTLNEFFEFVECNVGESVKLKSAQIVDHKDKNFDIILTQIERGKYVISEPAKETTAVVDTTLFQPVIRPEEEFAAKKLDPPNFGVTFIGTSHGFDTAKRTTSFVLWVDGKGILVDPLDDPKGTLHKYGIEEDQIPFIFLTHVHADHDAGVLRLVLNGKRIKLITSRVIYESLLRKVHAMASASDIRVDFSKYIDFIEVAPGQILEGSKIGLPDLTLEIGAALHSIPTIRFVAKYNDGSKVHSLFYSGDTYYDPQALQQLQQKGVLSDIRLNDLLNFGWDADQIIHEAGIPPIHTPQKVLQTIADSTRKPIYLVHTSKVEEGISLPEAKEGQNLILVSRPESSYHRVYEALGENPLLSQLTIALANEMVRTGRIKTYNPEEMVIQEGSRGNSFYFIIKGRVRVKIGDETVAILSDSNYFGEAALLTGKPRNASIQSATQTTLLKLPEGVFTKMLKQFPFIKEAMEKTLNIRPALSKVQILKGLPAKALEKLTQSFIQSSYRAGEDIIVQGESGHQFFLLAKGKVDVIVQDNGERWRVAQLTAGDVFGEIALIENAPRTATIRAATDVTVWVLDRMSFQRITEETPALHFGLTRLARERKQRTEEFCVKNLLDS